MWIDPTKKKKKEKNWMIDPVLLFISFCSNQLSPIFCGAEPTSITWNNGIALSSTYLYIERFFKLSHKWVEIIFELEFYLYEIFISLQFLYFDTIDYYPFLTGDHFTIEYFDHLHLLWSSKHSIQDCCLPKMDRNQCCNSLIHFLWKQKFIRIRNLRQK